MSVRADRSGKGAQTGPERDRHRERSLVPSSGSRKTQFTVIPTERGLTALLGTLPGSGKRRRKGRPEGEVAVSRLRLHSATLHCVLSAAVGSV